MSYARKLAAGNLDVDDLVEEMEVTVEVFCHFFVLKILIVSSISLYI